MTHDKFKEITDTLHAASQRTMSSKNHRYSTQDDALHNFKVGAEIMGCTPAQTCWAYMTKHLVALRDKVQRNDFEDKADLLEKCQDTINYIQFIWAIANEEKNENRD